MLQPKQRISQILERKKREDPIGLLSAQREGRLVDFLSADLLAAGINPESVEFGSSNPNSPSVKSQTGAAASPLASPATKNAEAIDSQNYSYDIDSQKKSAAPVAEKFKNMGGSPKCVICSKSVFKMEELSALGCTWHKSCFTCGGASDLGCKKVLNPNNFEKSNGHPLCSTCFGKQLKSPRAAGTGTVSPLVATQSTTVAPVADPQNYELPSEYVTKKLSVVPDKFKNVGGSASKCPSCTKSVFKMEEIFGLGQSWHKSCFVCGGAGEGGCKRVLTQDAYENISGQPFCRTCFKNAVSVSNATQAKTVTAKVSVDDSVPAVVAAVPEPVQTPLEASEEPKEISTGVSVRSLLGNWGATKAAAPVVEKKPVADKFKSLGAASSNTNKCPTCTKTVYKAEELFALNCSWHPTCFTCGGTGSNGCKRKLSQQEFQNHLGAPFCAACFQRVSKESIAAQKISPRGGSAAAAEPAPFVESVPEPVHPVEPTPVVPDEVVIDVPKISLAQRAAAFKVTETSNTGNLGLSGPKPVSASADKFRAAASNASKCPVCTKTVFKAEELCALKQVWHQSCFTCGGTGDQGCKRRLKLQDFQNHKDTPYCVTCCDRLVKADMSRGKVLKAGEVVATPAPINATVTVSEPEVEQISEVESAVIAAPEPVYEPEPEPVARSVREPEPEPVREPEPEPVISVASEPEPEPVAVLSAVESVRASEYQPSESEKEMIIDTARVNQIADTEETRASFTVTTTIADDDMKQSWTQPAAVEETTVTESTATGVNFTDVEFDGAVYRGYQLEYEFDFDENGALYWIGSKGKTETFQNPHNTGAVTAAMSTVYKGEVSNVVARSIELAPNYTNNAPNSFFAVDFGPNRLLLADKYTIRHGASGKGNAMRHWKLQAKMSGGEDEDDWITLREHNNDESIADVANASASWDIVVPSDISDSNSIGFRQFRIVQTGNNTKGNNCFFCCGLEFYGVLFEKVE